MRARNLRDAVVVITGASSGIGRAAALAFARRGACVALASRRGEMLEEVAAQCRAEGAPQAIAVPTDVTDAAAMRHLADTVAERFGRIDIWINNAGVGAVGAFAETPVEAHDQVIRTNLLGYLHGAHAVLPHFLRRRSGVLISTISFGGWVPAPFAASYSASKFGLRGLTDALRAELRRWPDIHVCDVFPSFIDTPGVQHGANYTGRALKPAPPVYAPGRVARAMVRLAERPRRGAATVGAVATLARLGYALAPGMVRGTMDIFIRAYLRRAEPAPVTDGNLFHPQARRDGTTGGWRSPGQRGVAAAALLATGVVGGLYLLDAGGARRRWSPRA